MDTIKSDFQQHKKMLFIGLIAVVAIGFLLFKDWGAPDRVVVTGGERVVAGQFTCLPETGIDFGGDECKLGIYGEDKLNYGIDVSGIQMGDTNLKVEDRVEVTGTMVPIEEISSDAWEDYDVVGIIKVVTLKKK